MATRETAKEPATILDRLQADFRRFHELNAALADPINASDPAKITAIARERGALARLAVPYGRYLEINSRIAEAEAVAAVETDAEKEAKAYETARMQQAQEEVTSLRGTVGSEVESMRAIVDKRHDAAVAAVVTRVTRV